MTRRVAAVLGAITLTCVFFAVFLLSRPEQMGLESIDAADISPLAARAVVSENPRPVHAQGPGGVADISAAIDAAVVQSSDAGAEADQHKAADADCESDRDCPLNSGCVDDRCVVSSCDVDSDCPAGRFCRVGNQATARPTIRVCVKPGSQQRGESCSDFGATSSCLPGLHCLFGRCGPRCDDDAGACSSTESCVQSYRESLSVCRPDCRKSGCPSDRVCLGLGQLAECVEPTKDNCLIHGCPQGETCDVKVQAEQATFRCRRTCDPLKPSCPEGTICGSDGSRTSSCYTKCIPGEPTQVCLQTEACLPIDEEGTTFGCR